MTPLAWTLLALVLLAAVALAVRWYVRLPFVELVIPEEKWELVTSEECRQWLDERRINAPFLGRRLDGQLYISFVTRRSARRFAERWLS